MIAGYELKWQVEDMISALEREKIGAQSQRQLDMIAAQLEIFERERERMEATGEGGEPEPGNPMSLEALKLAKAGRGRIVI